MARKTAGQGGESWDKEGELHGYYYQHKENVGIHQSNVYMIVDSETDKPVQVWGSTVLDNKFQEIPLGSEVWVTCEGKKKSKSGTSYTDYNVDYDDEDAAGNLHGVNEMLAGGEVLSGDEADTAKSTFENK